MFDLLESANYHPPRSKASRGNDAVEGRKMHRTRNAVLLSILFLSSSLFVSFRPPAAEARGSRGFSVRDIRGDYSVSFHGEITEGPFVGHVVAVGLGQADGKGNLRVARTINLNGSLVLDQTGVCTYSVNKSGAGAANCTFSTSGFPDVQEAYALVIVDPTEVDYISTTPGTAVLGIGKKQRPGTSDE
jgi:hypothetical protein